MDPLGRRLGAPLRWSDVVSHVDPRAYGTLSLYESTWDWLKDCNDAAEEYLRKIARSDDIFLDDHTDHDWAYTHEALAEKDQAGVNAAFWCGALFFARELMYDYFGSRMPKCL